MASIRDDEPLSTETFRELLRQLGYRTQTEAADALGIKQGYVSELNTGKKHVLPNTSLHKLFQALLREQALLRRVERMERAAGGSAEGPGQ